LEMFKEISEMAFEDAPALVGAGGRSAFGL
jgi:hypothetical protein